MAKKKGNLYGKTVVYESKAKFKKTSISRRRPKFSSMNKSKKRSFKKYNRGGRWTRDQTFIQMEKWLILDYHKILENQRVEEAVVIVVNTVTKDHSAIFIRVLVSKMFMFVINGDKGFTKDNV